MSDAPKTYWTEANCLPFGQYMKEVELAFVRRYAGMPAAGRSLLDVGCGDGDFATELTRDGFRATGLERDSSALDVARARHPDLTVVRSDALVMPFPDATFDVVTGVQMIDYFPDKETFFAEVYRVLKPGGLMIVQVSNRRSIKGILYRTYLKLKRRTRTAWYYLKTYGEQARLIRETGFEILGTLGYNWNVLQRQTRSRVIVHVYRFVETACLLSRLPWLSPSILIAARKPMDAAGP